MSAFGASAGRAGTRFSVWSATAARAWVSLFGERGREERIELAREADDVFSATIAGISAGQRYGFRADGPYDPENGLWFDPDKLLTDPYAVEIDRPYVHDPRLAARRGEGGDTAALMPKALVREPLPPLDARPPFFRPGGLIYELNVRSFTMLHPDIPQDRRGTLAALAHPAVIGHFTRLGVSAVELMPVTAWIDERHLPPLGLSNAWGYNPVSFMALDPRIAPGGISELRAAVETLHAAGIGVILDLVFNHTGESDALGPTLSLRGLDNPAYYRHAPDGGLVNDTGTGNTLACDRPVVRRLILDTLRHFVTQAGVDGFRFDLAPVLARSDDGFDARAKTLAAIAADPILADRVMIAEPWDIGPGGYRLGAFPPGWLEWNDRFRDDLRRFWRGDGRIGDLATRLAGSSDVFRRDGATATRSVNFVAAHDGMTLADLAAHARKHNEANGEDNRDGHDEISWNNGAEGPSGDAKVLAGRRRDIRSLLAALFVSRGTVMLTAGDEFGRSQGGNNNAYAQDNATTWLDWRGRDRDLEDFVAALAALRGSTPALAATAFLSGEPRAGDGIADVEWLRRDGEPMTEADWNDDANRRLAMVLAAGSGDDEPRRFAALFNGDRRAVVFSLPRVEGWSWRLADAAREEGVAMTVEGGVTVPGHGVAMVFEDRTGDDR